MSTASIVGGAIGATLVVIGIFAFVKRCHRLRILRRAVAMSVNANNANAISSRQVVTPTVDVTIEPEPIEKFLNELLNEKPVRFSSVHLSRFTNNYAEQLGAGGFGVVYKGQLPNGLKVAVKVLKVAVDTRLQEQLMAEIGSIGRTNHVNIVRLYGFCFDKETKALVYEYVEKGSLDKYLYSDVHLLEWKKLYEIGVGAAKGLRYMHEECQKKIVHYDIKPANILLTSSFCAKVADFGLAKICDRESSHVTLTGGRGTPGYAAPELWMGFRVTEKCDVYSFGMVLFEILGRRKNINFMVNESMEWFPKWVWERFEQGDMETILSESKIQEEDKQAAKMMCQVALWCVQYQAEARPTMGSVVRMLEGEMEIVPPINPFLYLTQSDASSSTATWSGTNRESSSPLNPSRSS